MVSYYEAFFFMGNLVAIQGIKGSFHHIASELYFGQGTQVIECMTFDETADHLVNKSTDVAVMAIENSIAGSILPNYAIIDYNNLVIHGEYYLDIQHHLMALNGQKIDDIKEVYSHPMALLQCKKFFRSYDHIKLIEDKDTAEVAKRISDHKLKGIAAISSELSSSLYGLEILKRSIQTIKHNETRFVIVKRHSTDLKKEGVDKASLKFELSHKRGSLATVLNVLSDFKMSLTKIQSLPKIEMPWKYAFFVDVTFDAFEDYNKAKAIMTIMAEEFKVLGEYENAKK